MEKVAYLGHTITRWQVGSSTFLALPEKGARLMNWNLLLGDGTLRDVIHWPQLTELGEFARIRGGNPILFPFNARTFDAGRIHNWRDPAGQSRPMPMHGFARQGEFKVTRLDGRGFSAQLLPSAEAAACYPYRYEFTVAYRFAELSLACEFTLANHDTQPIPWSAGHHFYFTVPWAEGLTRQDYTIRIPAARTLRQDSTGQLITGPVIAPVTSLATPELVDTFFLGLKSPVVSFGPSNGPDQVSVTNGTAAVPAPEATFVTWSPDAQAPFYCVEPWMGPPNSPETKLGLHWVKPGQTERYVVEVAIT